MPDYKSMYIDLFNAVTDAIEQLQQAQRQAEEAYISAQPVELRRTSAEPRKPHV